MQRMLFERLKVAGLGAVGFPQTTGIPVSQLQSFFHYHNSRVFSTGPLSHPDLSALILAFLLLLSTSFLPHSWLPLCRQLFIPASSSLPSWSQPVPLVCSPEGPCQSSLNTLLQAPVLPRSGFPSQFPSRGSFFQPHRITAVGRCLWRLSSPIPHCSKQSQLKQVAPQVLVSVFSS